NQWLGLTVHIRPRTPAEPVAAQPPVLPPVSEPEATPESAPEAPAEIAYAAPESIQAPAVEAPAAEEAPVEPSVLDEVAAAAASLPAAAYAAAPVAPAAPVAEQPSEPLAAPVPGATAGGFDENQDIDADIREVFLEEFEEERANLARLLPMWLRSPDDMERLRPIRRVFHTLKGSGRLVGASALGEFAWKIESMLNRVLDGTRPASPAVTSMVQQAATVLPQFDAALRGEGTLDLDLRAMEAVAERIAAGEETFHTLAPVAAAVAPVAEAAPVEPVAPVVAEGTPASVDSVLREILETEVATHLETVDAWIAAARLGPQQVDDPLLRAMHTMNGAFAMTDVPEITSVTDAAETYIKRAIAAAHVPGADAIETLADTAATIRGCIQALQAESPRIPSYAGLAERLRALAAALPEARWPQPEILDEEPEAIVAPLVETPVELTDMDLSRFLVESMAADEGETRAEATGESPAADPVGNAAPQAPEWSLDDAQAAFEPEVASFDAPSVEAPAASDEAFEIAAELSGDAVVSDAAGSAAWQLSDAPLADAGIETPQAEPVEEAATSDWTVEAVQLEETVAEPVQEPGAIEATSSDWSVEPVETAGLSGEIAASADTASVEDLAANAPSFEERVGVESFEATPVEAVEAAPVEQTVEETVEETVAEDQAREPVAEAPVAGEQPVEEVVAEA